MEKLIEINDFYEYLDALVSLKDCYIILAACDTMTPSPEKTNIGGKGYKKLERLGVKLLGADNVAEQFWSGYVAVLYNGEAVYEFLGGRNGNARYDFAADGFRLNVFSSPFKKDNRASVLINGKEHAVNRRGINFVVYSKADAEVVDSVCFDTWGESRAASRKIKTKISLSPELLKNHYDVGIYGLWYGANYGSMITYYALDNVVKSFGYKTAMIKNPLGRDDLDYSKLRRSHSLIFAKKHYEITPLLRISQMDALNQICDKFLLGSDQMWNYDLSRDYRQTYFLDFVDDKNKKIAYATSFGKDRYFGPDLEKQQSKKNLLRFDAISVRDDFSKRILADDFSIQADVVLDPVFLCSREKYDELIEEAELGINEKFIFAYILDPDPETGRSLNIISEKSGLKIAVIFNEDDNKQEMKARLAADEDHCIFLEGATVEEWLYCFKNSQMVITDSFHGCCFSTIFHKNFIVKKNTNRGGGRFDYLTGSLNLKDYMTETPEGYVELFDKFGLEHVIDYTFVDQKLEQECIRCRKWLQDALELPREQLPTVTMPERKDVKSSLIWPSIKCTGCGACVNACSADAILMKPNAEGFLNPAVDMNKCVNCGICASKCIALRPQYKNIPNPECYAFWASDEIRKISSSGGAFTVAAEYILDEGGYVAGAVYNEDYSVKHILISNKDDLAAMRGSKYMQSNVGNIYREVKQLLDKNRTVLFTGLPCQVAAMYSYLGSRTYEKLYTIDLVCHGITSQKVFDKYHKDVLGGKALTDLQFKAKQPWGWHAGMNARFEDGTEYSVPLERDPYFIAYLKNISKNKTCGECMFNRLPRQADLSIGDFWGIDRFNPKFNDNRGTSEILVNSAQGKKLAEKIHSAAHLFEPVPVKYALDGNPVMRNPYKMNKNRDYFFKNFDKDDFAKLTIACYKNDFRSKEERDLSLLDPNLHGIYYLAKAAALNCHGRKIVTWGQGYEFSRILKEYFGLSAEFIVYQKQKVNGTTVRMISEIKGKSSEYYFVSLERAFDAEAGKIMDDYGYKIEKDYIFRVHKPVVIENFDLSRSGYSDIYGNTVNGSSGIIKRIVFRGLNNKIIIGKNVHLSAKIEFDMGTNGLVTIGDGTVFANDFKFELFVSGNMRSTVRIGKKCHFQDGLIRLYAHIRNSVVLINDSCTFENNLHLHANCGKKIIIGRDCMFSYDIDVLAGDGHTIFDVKTGKNINCDYDNIPEYKNVAVFGDHVWVGKKAFILSGTKVGTGSIIGANSTVKGSFPNNCSVAGSPAKVIKKDVAWSRAVTTDIARCGSPEYVRFTNNAKIPIVAKNVLVIGGTRFMGVELVQELLRWGNNVTIATRGNRPDQFGDRVNRIRMDVAVPESVKKAFGGKYYDVIFDNLAYCSNYVRNVLRNVKCGRYVQISSVEVYYPAKGWLTEDKFNPYKIKQEWNSQGAGYVAGKRQAEAAVYQVFPQVSAVTVRIPYVTKTERLFYYCRNVVDQTPMAIKDINRGLTFVRSEEVGRFLPWIAAQNFDGPINLSSTGFITIKEILDYIERKTGKKAIIDMEKGEEAPFNVFKEEGMAIDVRKAETLGWQSSELKDWFWTLMDAYIAYAVKEGK